MPFAFFPVGVRLISLFCSQNKIQRKKNIDKVLAERIDSYCILFIIIRNFENKV